MANATATPSMRRFEPNEVYCKGCIKTCPFFGPDSGYIDRHLTLDIQLTYDEQSLLKVTETVTVTVSVTVIVTVTDTDTVAVKR